LGALITAEETNERTNVRTKRRVCPSVRSFGRSSLRWSLTLSSRLSVMVRVRNQDLVRGWLVVMHTHLYYFPLSLSLSRLCWGSCGGNSTSTVCTHGRSRHRNAINASTKTTPRQATPRWVRAWRPDPTPAGL